MKKENKKMAQQRKAKERKKQAVKRTVGTICKFGIPAVVLLAFITIMVLDPFSSKESNTETDTTTNTSTDTDISIEDTTTANSLSTDSALTVENGDTVNIDYVGSIDGVEFSGGNTYGMGTDLTIGSGQYIDDFEEQLIGAHPGDTVNVNVTFPENYGSQDLAGKDALFVVTVNGIYE